MGNFAAVSHLLIQRKDYLAVAAGLKTVFPRKAAADILMVVNLSVDRQHQRLVGRKQRLPTALGVHNTQTFVGQDGTTATPDSTPVGTAMPYAAAHLERFLAQRVRLFSNIEYSNYSTHNKTI